MNTCTNAMCELVSSSMSGVAYINPAEEQLCQMVSAARSRLAGQGALCTPDRHALDAVWNALVGCCSSIVKPVIDFA